MQERLLAARRGCTDFRSPTERRDWPEKPSQSSRGIHGFTEAGSAFTKNFVSVGKSQVTTASHGWFEHQVKAGTARRRISPCWAANAHRSKPAVKYAAA